MLEILKISKKFVNSSTPVLDEVSLRVEEGECLSLLGPSGCGKTTLLRILAGLETPDSGDVTLDGKSVLRVDSFQRPFHMVFQKHALFPHLSVFENVAFALRLRKRPEDEIQARVQETLKLVRLGGFENRMPSTLSGGQSQRVAVARALVNRPRVLLLDEPFSALDLKLREGMAQELRDLQKSLGLTFLFVTHDQQEAFALSDRVALMKEGRFEQIGSPQELYQRPKSHYAAHFVGSVSRLPVQRIVSHMQGKIEFESFGIKMRGIPMSPQVFEGPCVALVRPECFHLKSKDRGGFDNQMTVKVVDSIFRGSSILAKVRTQEGCEILVDLNPSDLTVDDVENQREIQLTFRAEDTLLCSLENT